GRGRVRARTGLRPDRAESRGLREPEGRHHRSHPRPPAPPVRDRGAPVNPGPPATLGTIASGFDLELRGGDAATPVDGVDTLGSAGPSRIAFLANPRYRSQLPEARAAAVILRDADAGHCPRPVLVARDPYVAFAKVASLFERHPAQA